MVDVLTNLLLKQWFEWLQDKLNILPMSTPVDVEHGDMNTNH